MFTINNIQLRNLEEQVQKNKEDIANHYAVDRALANLGIEVVGQVAVSGDLPDPTTYAGKFGDAYAVGNKAMVDIGEATYDYYVYTRPDANAGQPTNYWLNVGKISIVGPVGPQGPQGEKGNPGNDAMWLTGSFDPTGLGGTYPNGTLYLAVNANPPSLNGNVYKFDAILGQWGLIGNIRGSQGIQGIQGPVGPQGPQGEPGPTGEKGDVGGFINIIGILDNTGQLPDPATLDNLTYAYLVLHTGGTDQANDHYDLYIQVGMNSNEATWNNVGPFNAATLVTVNGAGQNVWNADTKLDKNTNVSEVAQLYFKTPEGVNRMINIVSSVSQGLAVGIPNLAYLQENYMLANDISSQIMELDSSKLNAVRTPASNLRVYGIFANGGQTTFSIENGATRPNANASAIAQYHSGKLSSNTPTADYHVATKEYVDSKAGGISIISPSDYDNASMTAIGAVVEYTSEAWPVYQFVPITQITEDGITHYSEAIYSIVIGTPDGSNITMVNDYIYYTEEGSWGIGNYGDFPIKGGSFSYNKSIQYLYVK